VSCGQRVKQREEEVSCRNRRQGILPGLLFNMKVFEQIIRGTSSRDVGAGV
jgi:hypothetical protein